MIYKQAPRVFPLSNQSFKVPILKSDSSAFSKMRILSSKTKDEVYKYLKEEDDKTNLPKQCSICKDIKFSSMSHCVQINRCVVKYDHYSPKFNNWIAMHNGHYFVSLWFYTCITGILMLFNLLFNIHAQFWYEYLYTCRAMTLINLVMSYAAIGYWLLEIYLNAKGRTVYEIIIESVISSAKPRFSIGAKWRENIYLSFGSKSISPVLIFPYAYGSPLTGLEYCLMSDEIKKQLNIWDEFVETVSSYFTSNS